MAQPVWAAIILLLSPFTADGQTREPIGHLSFYLGQTELRPSQARGWSRGQLRAKLGEADSLRTHKKSRAEVKFVDGFILRIGEQVAVEIVGLPEGGRQVNIDTGEAWIKALLLAGGRPGIRVRTPTSVAGIRGTVYRVTTDSTHAHYRVYGGSISVTPLDLDGSPLDDTTITVAAGSELIIIRDFSQYRQQQQAALNQFIQEDTLRFAEYERRQAEMFRVFQLIDQQRFQSFQSLNITTGEFDQARDAELDWVRWNLERDGMIEGDEQ